MLEGDQRRPAPSPGAGSALRSRAGRRAAVGEAHKGAAPSAPEISRHVAREAGLDDAAIASAEGRALINGTDLQSELLACGAIGERGYFEAAARMLGVACMERLRPDDLVLRERDCLTLLARGARGMPVRVAMEDGRALLLVAPDQRDLARMQGLLDRHPGLRERVALVLPSEIRRALFARGRTAMMHRVRGLLFETLPDCSARIVASAPQGFFVGAVLSALAIGIVLAPLSVLLAAHALATVCFLACVALRTLAAIAAQPRRRKKPPPIDPRELPTYTVLVALYREAEVVPELLTSLSRLSWPRAKLEIKLICEADDRETIDAIRALRPEPCVEIVEVPAEAPRTKPRALAFALQASSGELVGLYDAEDRPHPWQLLEAWHRFKTAGPDLACVQAPLHVTNGTSGLLPAAFAFEYVGLFRGLLPFLSAYRLLLPLGGTSNHFRRTALERVGGWDPFNVTEDADLGVRLARFGYRAGTITLPTHETAPEELPVWMRQRTRWFKGWMQTWLVHMRHPLRLLRELGPLSFLVAQILFAGMILSALLHPMLAATLVFLIVDFVRGHDLDAIRSTLLGLDIANIAFGYGAFLLLGVRAAPVAIGRNLLPLALFTPVYWLLLSAACWRALWQLLNDPFLWEKTPHKRGLGIDPDT